MGADFIVDQPCEAKRVLGQGDTLAGSQRLLDQLKARARAEVVRQNGQTSVTVLRVTPEGQQEEEVSLATLEAECAPLETLAEGCAGCPANVLGTPYGCVGFVPYPVDAAGEQTLVARLQPVESPGGFLLASAVKDFDYDGAGIKRMRAAGLFEAREAPQKVIQKKLFGSVKISGDQLFHTLFSVGGALNPDHCAMVLSFIGALEVDGQVPATHAAAPRFQHALATRSATLRLLDLDPEHPLNRLVRALERAWRLGVPLLMDA